MPLIQSKKYKTEQFVTVEAWKEMQEKGFDSRFRVVDDGDIQDTVIKTPVSFTDFSQPVETVTQDEDNMDRDELKEWLTEHEIEFNPRTSNNNLRKLYLDNK